MKIPFGLEHVVNTNGDYTTNTETLLRHYFQAIAKVIESCARPAQVRSIRSTPSKKKWTPFVPSPA